MHVLLAAIVLANVIVKHMRQLETKPLTSSKRKLSIPEKALL